MAAGEPIFSTRRYYGRANRAIRVTRAGDDEGAMTGNAGKTGNIGNAGKTGNAGKPGKVGNDG
jgi:hypothetical protein